MFFLLESPPCRVAPFATLQRLLAFHLSIRTPTIRSYPIIASCLFFSVAALHLFGWTLMRDAQFDFRMKNKRHTRLCMSSFWKPASTYPPRPCPRRNTSLFLLARELASFAFASVAPFATLQRLLAFHPSIRTSAIRLYRIVASCLLILLAALHLFWLDTYA